MQTRKIKGFPTIFPHIESCEAPSPANCIKIPCQNLYVGRRGSGKTYSCYLLLRQLKECDLAHRIFLMSPTASSRTNVQLWESLDVKEGDRFEELTLENLKTILEEVEKEGREFREYQLKLETHTKLHRYLRLKNCDVLKIPDEILLLADVWPELWEKEPPTHKYGGKQPCMHVVFDDCQGSTLMRTPTLLNMIIKHRHLGNGIGLSTHFAVQSYMSAQGGCPRPLRGNCTTLILFRTHDAKMMKTIVEEISEVPPDVFLAMYEEATNEEHRPLIVEITPKKPDLMYRAGWNTLLIPRVGREAPIQIAAPHRHEENVREE